MKSGGFRKEESARAESEGAARERGARSMLRVRTLIAALRVRKKEGREPPPLGDEALKPLITRSGLLHPSAAWDCVLMMMLVLSVAVLAVIGIG